MYFPYYIGLDLGQRRDHSALVLVERLEIRRGYQAPLFGGLAVRYLERFPLGTSYPAVVERVREIVKDYWMAGKCCLTVDATGVGVPVMDMLRAAQLGCEIVEVTITGGNRENENGSTWKAPRSSVPKRDLIAGVQVLLESKELKIAGGLPEAGALVKELVDVRMTAREKGKVRIGADGPGEHDDLAIALALAVWKARKGKQTIGWGEGRLI